MEKLLPIGTRIRFGITAKMFGHKILASKGNVGTVVGHHHGKNSVREDGRNSVFGLEGKFFEVLGAVEDPARRNDAVSGTDNGQVIVVSGADVDTGGSRTTGGGGAFDGGGASGGWSSADGGGDSGGGDSGGGGGD